MKETADAILKKFESGAKELETWKTHAELNARYFKPQLEYVNQQPGTPDFYNFRGLFTSSGIDAVNAYSLGLIAEVFPSNEKWMVWTAQDDHKVDDEARAWYNKCGEIALTHLGRSNFYQALKPMVDDMAVAGTGAVHIRKGMESLLAFHYCMFGSYWIEENSEGKVRTIYRCFKRTASQIVEEFGEEAVGQHVKKAYEANDSNTKFTIVHAVFERRDRNKKSIAAEDMRFASVYVCKEDKNIIERGGLDSFPYAVSRAEMWDEKCFGLSPATKAMPTMQQANKLMRDLDESVALMTRPPWIIPSGLVSQVDRRRNGQTVYKDSGNEAKPEQMAMRNDVGAGYQLYEAKVQEIRTFFHASLFESIADKDKQMTAREVAAIENSALRRFLPQFNQITSELSPIFAEVFDLLFAAGMFPDPPASVRVPTGDQGVDFIPPPKVEFTSRIALAIRMVENSAIDRTLERVLLFAEFMPQVLENFDMDELVRIASRNDGLPEKILVLKKEVDKMREEKAAQQQALQEAEQAALVAQTVKTAGDTNVEGLNQALGAVA